jgi:hypothetical protein
MRDNIYSKLKMESLDTQPYQKILRASELKFTFPKLIGTYKEPSVM